MTTTSGEDPSAADHERIPSSPSSSSEAGSTSSAGTRLTGGAALRARKAHRTALMEQTGTNSFEAAKKEVERHRLQKAPALKKPSGTSPPLELWEKVGGLQVLSMNVVAAVLNLICLVIELQATWSCPLSCFLLSEFLNSRPRCSS